MQKIQSEFTRADTLVITVGTRQVGWRCKDGVVRCFGADGDRGHPPHIDELCRELGIERGFHEVGNQASRWSVRELGRRYYEYCRDVLAGNFKAVELLLDSQIIADSVAKGLKYLILWATDQPESVPWVYRRADTYWLAELMKGKIQATWPDLKVDVLHPSFNANNREIIRQELEGFILPIALEQMNQARDEQFVLIIENKGAVPTVAESLEICAAALVRQCQVYQANPIEPQPLYELQSNGFLSAQTSRDYQRVPVSEYFWSLERSRVISAWERGDFLEARVWLTAHQHRHKRLYQLASYLALSANWEISKFLQDKNFENGWLRANDLVSLASTQQIQQWKEQLLNLRQDELAQTWEAGFLIELSLFKEQYSSAFMQFAQTLERILYVRSQREKWLSQGLIVPPDYLRHKGDAYEPNFYELINAWAQLTRITKSDKWYVLLTEIRDRRNKIVHKAEPLTLMKMRSLWADNGFTVAITNDSQEAMKLMLEVLKKVCNPKEAIPEKPLLRSLYEWGLGILRAELASSQLEGLKGSP